MSSDIAIGIDLGTTYSCVAVYQNGKINVITNAEGNKTTPSEVAFTEFERLVGQAAKNQGSHNPKNTIFDAKRLIGRRYDDQELQAAKKNYPFRIVAQDSQPLVEVQSSGEFKHFTPEQISGMVLKKMKETAERYLGHQVKDAVITVPAYFNDGQRQATKDAATIAGLNVLRIINEPTAAALAFGLEKNFKEKQKVLVFDLGGGTFDVSIVTISPGNVFEVNATTGDTHFGGSDFDQRMLEHFVKEFNREHRVDITGHPRSIRRLRTACELAKRSLSSNVEETVVVDALYDGIDIYSKITRVKFEALCSDLFRKILDPVKGALSDARMDKSEIDEVVLVGGSTRIPKVQQIIKDFFDGKALNQSINPDEAVAYGAAAQAAILSGVRFHSFGQLVLRDVTPLSLGIEIKGQIMSNIIVRNTPIPVKKTSVYYTTYDYQTEVDISIYEGERSSVPDNHKLGYFRLVGVPPLPRGQGKVEVTFEINEDGILKVTAVVQATGKFQTVTIKKGRLETKDIDRMINEAKSYDHKDKLYRERVLVMNQLEDYVYKIRDVVNENVGILSIADSQTMRTAQERELAWLEANRDALKETLESRYKAMQTTCGPIIAKIQV